MNHQPPTPTTSTTLSATGLQVRLGDALVVDGLDLSVQPGAVVGLIGPNGAGKTTALRALLRLVELDAGQITLGEEDITHVPPHRLAGRVSYLPQGHVAHWPLSVDRLVALGRLPHLNAWQKPGAEDRQAIDRAIAATDTRHLVKRSVTTLSGGERARVLLARALAVEAPILVVDEPVVSLDPEHQLSVMDTLRAYADSGKAVLVVLHDLDLAHRYCDRLILMQDGCAVADGAPSDVLTNALLARVYHVERDADGMLQRIIPPAS